MESKSISIIEKENIINQNLSDKVNNNNIRHNINYFYILPINNQNVEFENEESLCFNPDYYAKINRERNENSIFNYFGEEDIINEVNEDMEESSSEKKIINKKRENKIKKTFKKYNNEAFTQ